VEIESERDLAALAFFLDPGIERAEEADAALGAEPDAVADRQSFARLGESLPARTVETLMQQGFDPWRRVTAPDPVAGECGGNDFRLIENEDVAGIEQRGKIADDAVFETIGLYDEKLRSIAWMCRPQRDAVFRQIEIEIGDAHDGVPEPSHSDRYYPNGISGPICA
jgi:hypothetical protein